MATQHVEDSGTSIPQNALLDSAELVLDEATLESLASDPTKVEDEPIEPKVDEEQGESSKAAEPDKTEQEALAAGWVTKQEWVERHGSEKGWKPATDFMDVRRNLMPLVQRENRELRAKLDALEAKIAEKDATEAKARADYERSSLKLELKQAREDGDWDRVEALTDKMLDLKVAEKAAPVARSGSAPTPNPEVQRAFVDFASANKWVNTDDALARQFAIEVKNIIEATPKLPIEDVLREAKEALVSRYPHKFNGRRTAMAESSGSPGNGSGTGRRSWSDLKPEYREAYNDKYFQMNPEVKRENLLRHMPADAFRN